jgi:hypothetical protein
VNPAADSTSHILNALRHQQTPERWESEFVKAGISWDQLSIRAIIFGLGPLLHQRLDSWDVELPDSARLKLAANAVAHDERNVRLQTQLGEILEAGSAIELRPLALKGMHLSAGYYLTPGLRPMNDIDLLFGADDIEAAGSVLQDLGYEGKHKSAEVGPGVTKHTSTYRRPGAGPQTPNPYLSTEAEATVEPHGSLEESWFGLQVDITPGVRARATTIQISGQDCQVLEPNDLLLHLCVHFAFHLIMGQPAMVQLVDLLTVTASGQVDWQVFTERTIAAGAASYGLASLTLAKKLLGAPVPDAVLHQFGLHTPKALRAQIDGFGLAHIMQRTQQKPLTRLRDRLRRGVQDRIETARWAADLRGRLRVWGTLFAVWKTDTARILIHDR